MAENIKVRFIIQIAGKPLENVAKAIDLILKKLKEETEKFKVTESEIIEPELDTETTLYSGLIEITVKFKEIAELLDFIFDYTPNSIEIEEPRSLKLDMAAFNDILNDMSAHILGATSEIMNLRAHVHVLNKQMEDLKKSGK